MIATVVAKVITGLLSKIAVPAVAFVAGKRSAAAGQQKDAMEKGIERAKTDTSVSTMSDDDLDKQLLRHTRK